MKTIYLYLILCLQSIFPLIPISMADSMNAMMQQQNRQDHYGMYVKCYGKYPHEHFWQQNKIWAKDQNTGNDLHINGNLENGVFYVSQDDFLHAQENCESTLLHLNGEGQLYQIKASNSILQYSYPIAVKRDKSDPPYKVVVFGDSLSDNGNIHRYSLGFIAGLPYFGGRLSNGPVWAEYYAKNMQLPLENYAYAGSNVALGDNLIKDEKVKSKILFSLRKVFSSTAKKQVKSYLSYQDPRYIEDNIHVFVLGHVDYLAVNSLRYFQEAYFKNQYDVIEAFTHKVVDNLFIEIKKVMAAGARKIVISDILNFDILPNDDPEVYINKDLMRKIREFHNKYLYEKLQPLILNPKLAVYMFYFGNYITEIFKSPTRFGFSNIENSCYLGLWLKYDPMNTPVCDSPENYFFYDPYHPTTKVHEILGEKFTKMFPLDVF